MTASRALLAALLMSFAGYVGLPADPPKQPESTPGKVSYYKDVRPIFAQHCNGCHQPAKPGGAYIMTDHAELLKMGESAKPGVVPGKPRESLIVEQIKRHPNGKAEMPKGRDPLPPAQVQLVTDWITQGATDDTPPSAKSALVDADHPPAYSAPPVVTAAAFSPDGNTLAVSGYHEVLLYNTKTDALEARLIGMSERINALAFSPNGQRLAVAGGSPGRFGEIQIWDHAKKRLVISAPVTFDTLYGVSWSPKGDMVAFGCADNTVRAIDPISGKQMLFMGTHSDWVLGTAFSQDGEHLVSISRDMTMKLTEVPTQRFVDNVTSITPGALKGGLMAVDRRPVEEPRPLKLFGAVLQPAKPKRMQKVPPDTPGTAPKLYDELIAAGSDGTPRLYKMHREQKREIGDDANKVREYEKMPGRISCLAFSPDGKFFAATSSLDGKGQVWVYETDTGKKVACEKVAGPAYTAAWHPDGKTIVSAGFDGKVWLHDAATGKLLREFVVLPTVKG
ncbi:MAG TPA: c-type cytochrome domain-containing protein [Gemmataceae bacterium]|nr:c-type cytochrome domain-containing protein [Gemmataceae bacterium]